MCNQVMPGCVAPARRALAPSPFPGAVIRSAMHVLSLPGSWTGTLPPVMRSSWSGAPANACAHSDSGRPGGSYTVRFRFATAARARRGRGPGELLERFVHGNREPARAVPRSLTRGRVRHPPGGPRMGDLVCARAAVTSASAWNRARAARQTLASVANGPSAAATTPELDDIINAHADCARAGHADQGRWARRLRHDRLADLVPQIADAR